MERGGSDRSVAVAAWCPGSRWVAPAGSLVAPSGFARSHLRRCAGGKLRHPKSNAVPAASCAIRARIRASPSALRGGKCGAGAGVDRPSFAAPYANTQPTPNTKAPGSARLMKVRLQRAALARSLLMGDLEAAIAHHTGSEWTFTVVP